MNRSQTVFMQLTYQKLKPFALSYLTAPLAVFFAGYLRAPFAVAGLAVLAFAWWYAVCKTPQVKQVGQEEQGITLSVPKLVLLFALPLAVVVPFQTELFSDDPIAVESEREPFQPGDLDGEMVLKVLAGDAVEEMTLGEYLVGVVRAEMPASFEPEALKAQAVAARTYTCLLYTSPSPRD